MINYGVVGVGYFGAELARIMKKENDAKEFIMSIKDKKAVVTEVKKSKIKIKRRTKS